MSGNAFRPVQARDAGYTLIELLVVVVVIGVMASVAIGSLMGIIGGMNNSMVQSSLQSARVALAAAAVADGTVPTSIGGGAAMSVTRISFPSSNPEFQVGYVPFCYQVLSNTGASTGSFQHYGACASSDTAIGSGTTKPLVETDFVLCGRYGGTGQIYIADTWHSVQPYTSGGTWSNGGAMDLRGCTPKPITSSDGSVPAQP